VDDSIKKIKRMTDSRVRIVVAFGKRRVTPLRRGHIAVFSGISNVPFPDLMKTHRYLSYCYFKIVHMFNILPYIHIYDCIHY
jgi:hypothetical protein